ncbi:MAG TPA: hypothetical protein VHO95_00805, partial [Candidatus Dormibacteraeota bacterium]|nr:hypothetical protein [Candidatus Dormibacteraeota bacterium]
MRWLAWGAGLGVGLAVVGAVAAGIATSDPVTRASTAWFLLLGAVPIVAFYGFAIGILFGVRRRWRAGVAESNVALIGGARNQTTFAMVLIAIGLVPSAYIAAAGPLGIIGFDTTTTADTVIAWLAFWWSHAPLAAGAMVSLYRLSQCRSAMQVRISDDLRWWWDGDEWREIRGGADRIRSDSVEPHTLDAARSRAAAAISRSFFSIVVALGVGVLATVAGVAAYSDLLLLILIFGTLSFLAALVAVAALAIAWRSHSWAEPAQAGIRWSSFRRWTKAGRVCLW